jgi:hypothetical protein
MQNGSYISAILINDDNYISEKYWIIVWRQKYFFLHFLFYDCLVLSIPNLAENAKFFLLNKLFYGISYFNFCAPNQQWQTSSLKFQDACPFSKVFCHRPAFIFSIQKVTLISVLLISIGKKVLENYKIYVHFRGIFATGQYFDRFSASF